MSPDSLETLEDQDSPQYESFTWMVSDPEYFSYTPDRILQRWVLGVLYLGLSERMERDGTFADILEDWMTDENECFWYSSRPNDVCNDEGHMISLDIRDAELYGTLPPELSLLTNLGT